MTQTIRVALVNDYEIVLEGLRALLRPHEPEICVVEVDIDETPRRAVDVTLLDTYGEEMNMIERVRKLTADRTNGAVVVFSFSDRPRIAQEVIDEGAQGFISKAVPASVIADGIRAAARGEQVMLTHRSQRATVPGELRWPGREIGLTERESELLALLPTGMSNRELAAHLFLSENTIKTQLRGLYSKLQVRNRTQAVAVARSGLLGEQRPRRRERE
jgi:NarL family two-component system response regulator LiaR